MPFADLESTKAHLRHGIKTGLACVLSYVLTLAFHLDYGYWAVLSTVIVMQINVADSIQMCWYRFTGTFIGALFGVSALLLFPPTPLFTALSIFIVAGICAYLTRYNARFRMAAITAVIVMLASSGEGLGYYDRVLFGAYRVMEIAVGVGSAFVVSVAVWPVASGAALRRRLEEHFTHCAEAYNTLTEAFLSKQRNAPDDLLVPLEKEMKDNRALLSKALRHERLIFNSDTALLALQVEMLERCLHHLHVTLAAVNAIPDVPGQGFTIIMEEEIRALVTNSKATMSALGRGQMPDVAPLKMSMKQAHTRLEALRGEGVTKRFHLRKLLQVMSFLNNIQSLAEDLLRGVERMEELRKNKNTRR